MLLASASGTVVKHSGSVMAEITLDRDSELFIASPFCKQSCCLRLLVLLLLFVKIDMMGLVDMKADPPEDLALLEGFLRNEDEIFCFEAYLGLLPVLDQRLPAVGVAIEDPMEQFPISSSLDW